MKSFFAAGLAAAMPTHAAWHRIAISFFYFLVLYLFFIFKSFFYVFQSKIESVG